MIRLPSSLTSSQYQSEKDYNRYGSDLVKSEYMLTDFRLKVFKTVADRLSFTKAAAELLISQPAVTKQINEHFDQAMSAQFK